MMAQRDQLWRPTPHDYAHLLHEVSEPLADTLMIFGQEDADHNRVGRYLRTPAAVVWNRAGTGSSAAGGSRESS
jgi:hypothetical protein